MPSESVLLEAFADAHPDGFARVLEQAPAADSAAVLAELGPRRAARVLAEMIAVPAARCVEALEPGEAAPLVAALDVDNAASLLRRAGAAGRQAIVKALPAGRRQAVAQLLAHAPESAGALMDPLVLAVPQDLTAGETLARVRADPEHAMYYVYVVGARGELVGVVNQRELMIAAPEAQVVTLMTEQPLRIVAQAGTEAIADHPAWQLVHALPVVDARGVFLGAIRYEVSRKLERDLGRIRRTGDRAATAAALAELYGLGVAGMTEWAAQTVRGPRRPRRDRGDA